jgi:hypothetical protein
MFTFISAGLSAIAGFFKSIEWFQKRNEEDRQREVGRLEQENADLKQALKVNTEQLEIASKPDETREELLKKARGRKRTR